METMHEDTLISSSFLPCADFGTIAPGAPVCAHCGWLDTEHEPPVAEVHTLPVRPARRPAPKRLAS